MAKGCGVKIQHACNPAWRRFISEMAQAPGVSFFALWQHLHGMSVRHGVTDYLAEWISWGSSLTPPSIS